MGLAVLLAYMDQYMLPKPINTNRGSSKQTHSHHETLMHYIYSKEIERRNGHGEDT